MTKKPESQAQEMTYQADKKLPEVQYEEVAAEKCPTGKCKVGQPCIGASGPFHDRRIRKAQKQKEKEEAVGGKKKPKPKLDDVPTEGGSGADDDGETLTRKKKTGQVLINERAWVSLRVPSRTADRSELKRAAC